MGSSNKSDIQNHNMQHEEHSHVLVDIAVMAGAMMCNMTANMHAYDGHKKKK